MLPTREHAVISICIVSAGVLKRLADIPASLLWILDLGENQLCSRLLHKFRVWQACAIERICNAYKISALTYPSSDPSAVS